MAEHMLKSSSGGNLSTTEVYMDEVEVVDGRGGKGKSWIIYHLMEYSNCEVTGGARLGTQEKW